MDHAAIFLLIAGTYTPFTLVSLRGTIGWTFFSVIWVLAVTGIVLKVAFMNRLERVGHWLYLGMGWLGLAALYPMLQVLPYQAILWLFAGGLLYSLGVIFYVAKRMSYSHFIWHLFVLGGAACHFFAILIYLTPSQSV